jgi:ribonuclease-3
VSDPQDPVRQLEEAVGHRFAQRGLAETSLSHPSYAHEVDGSRGNERLEFLGDAVLDLIISRVLFERYPEWAEGELTRVRSSLVNQRALAAQARRLGLDALVRLGKTERQNDGHRKESILANCFEAVLGAIYLDGGLPAAEAVVHLCFDEAANRGPVARDAKTAFQEWAHAELRATPRYRLVEDSRIENDEARFTVEVVVEERAYGRGVGRTKRAAEAAAARDGLERHGSDA